MLVTTAAAAPATSSPTRANLSRFEGWFPELHAGVSAERGESGWGVGPVAEVLVPLFYQGAGETHVALSEMRRERWRASAVSVKIRSRARALTARLSAAERGASFHRQTLLPLRREVLLQTQLQYNAMNVGIFQLLAAKRAEVEADRAYVLALEEYWSVRTEVEWLLAGRLGQTQSRSAPLEALEMPAASH
jgi:hypothetical protein